MTTQLEQAINRAIASALAKNDPTARLLAVRQIVADLGDGRVRAADAAGIAAYQAQRVTCSCGASTPRPVDMRRHLDEAGPGHRQTHPGMTYRQVGRLMDGVTVTRTQQIMRRGAELLADLHPAANGHP